MIRLLGSKIVSLPDTETMRSRLPMQWVTAWSNRHGDPDCAKNAQAARQSLGGLLLLYQTDIPGTLRYAESGKPSLFDPCTDFSITHTEEVVLCAVATVDKARSAAPRVGVDAESLARIASLPVEKLSVRWFSDAERAQFQSRPTPDQFARIWTRKEALVKALGTGLSGLHAADTVAAENNGIRFTEYRAEDTLISLCHTPSDRAPAGIEWR